ncbi:hypothetical protein QJQ45_024956 [Haematococcus lacustris]|nr:hypothetical protein QJQ45_024956 [Haematococcus lacustris]
MQTLGAYKAWVCQHPGIVSNLDWLLYLTVWNPARTNGESSEVAYEAYHAVVGLLSVFHQHILEEADLPAPKPAAAIWLDMLEQVEVIYELRAMHLENMGKMSRYGPLTVLEVVKSCLKMMCWSQHSGHLFLSKPSSEDMDLIASEQGLQEVATAFARLRSRYTSLASVGADAANDMGSRLHRLTSWLLCLPHRAGAAWQHQMSSSPRSKPATGLGQHHLTSSHGIDWDKVPALGQTPAKAGCWQPKGAGLMTASAQPVPGATAGAASAGNQHAAGAVPIVPGSLCWQGDVRSKDQAPPLACPDWVDEYDRQQQQEQQRQQQASYSWPHAPPGMTAKALRHRGLNLMWLGEILHVWRPAMYCSLLHRYGGSNWRPWWGSLALDLLSAYFTQRGKLLLQLAAAATGLPRLTLPLAPGLKPGTGNRPDAGSSMLRSAEWEGQAHGEEMGVSTDGSTSLLSLALVRGLAAQHWTPGEAAELAERRRRLLLYLVRPPFVDAFVRKPTAAVQLRTARVPLVGTLTSYLAGLLDTVTTYYSYTARRWRPSQGSDLVALPGVQIKWQRVLSSAELASALELTSSQADMLGEVLGSLSVLNRTSSDWPMPGSEQIFAHEVSFFLFAQLFSKEALRPDNQEVWPEAGLMPMPTDGMLSPTRSFGKSIASGKALLRQQLQQHLRNQTHALRGFGDYIRRNLRFLCELSLTKPAPETRDPSTSSPAATSGSPATHTKAMLMGLGLGSGGGASGDPPTTITALELDRLRFLMQPPQQRQATPISSLVPGLSAPGASTPVDVAVAALRQLWHEETVDSPRFGYSTAPSYGMATAPFGPGACASPRAQRHCGLVGPTGQVDDSSISGMHKGTIVRGEADVPGGVLRITDCHDSVLYILTPLQAVLVSGCSDCTVVVGAAGRIVRLDRCDKVQLTAAAARVLVSSCHDCTLHLATPRPPLLVGDCRFVKLAPFNTRYEHQLGHLHAARLRVDAPNQWDSPVLLAVKERKGQPGSSASSSSGLGFSPDSPRASAAAAAGGGAFGLASSPLSMPGKGLGGAGGGSGGSGGGASSAQAAYSLLPPEDFLPFVVPFKGAGGVLAGELLWLAPQPALTGCAPAGAPPGSSSPAAMLDPLAAGGPAPPATTAWRHMVPANGTNGTVVGQAGEQQGSRAGSEAPSQGVGPEEGPTGGSKAGGKAGGKTAGPASLFPLPPAYERALHKKLSMTTELRHRFRQAGLSKEREAELNNTIQSYFKEWLSSNSLLRQIYDLSNLEKDELASSATLLGLQAAGEAQAAGPQAGNAREKVTLNL